LDIKRKLDRWLTGRKQARAPEPPPAPAAEATAVAAVEPEIVAVIAAVVAVEVKMFTALQGPRFTFSEDGRPQGWSDWGRLLVGPFQGVR
jgi:hypothetical protein